MNGIECCIDDEIPFEIPDSWEWVRLGNIINLLSGQDLTPEKYNDDRKGIPYITGASNFSNENITVNRWTLSPKVIAQQGDLLITCKGTIGEMAFLQYEQAHIARQIMAIRTFKKKYIKYIKFCLDTYITNLNASAKSMIPGISRNDLLKIIMPFPPLAEQERIIKQINVVFATIHVK